MPRVVVAHDGDVSTITMQGEPHNLLGAEMRAELLSAFGEATNAGARAVVLTGNEATFSAGADLNEDAAGRERPGGYRSLFSEILGLFDLVERLPVPVIAAIQGPAFGAGLELACACDLRTATPEATFCASGVNVGLIAGHFRLPRIIGLGYAKEMLFTGNVYDAAWAADTGLVNSVSADALGAATEYAARIASRSPSAVARSKASMHASLAPDLELLSREHLEVVTELAQTPEHAEAVRAFLEKRRPRWSG